VTGAAGATTAGAAYEYELVDAAGVTLDAGVTHEKAPHPVPAVAPLPCTAGFGADGFAATGFGTCRGGKPSFTS
jgi:hypothetical protein